MDHSVQHTAWTTYNCSKHDNSQQLLLLLLMCILSPCCRYKLEGKCIYCNKDDFCCGYGPRTLVICSCCNNLATHVECLQRHTGNTLSEEFLDSGSDWFCSTVSMMSFKASIMGLLAVRPA
jgi:hypothetical protein